MFSCCSSAQWIQQMEEKWGWKDSHALCTISTQIPSIIPIPLIAHKSWHGCSRKFITPRVINTTTKIPTLCWNLLKLLWIGQTLFFPSGMLPCPDENLISIQFPIRACFYIPSFLSFVGNILQKSKQFPCRNTNPSVLCSKGKERKALGWSSSEGTVILRSIVHCGRWSLRLLMVHFLPYDVEHRPSQRRDGTVRMGLAWCSLHHMSALLNPDFFFAPLPVLNLECSVW